MTDQFFVSKKAFYLHALLVLEGKQRIKALGGDRDELYRDKKEAKKWLDSIMNTITNGEYWPEQELAKQKLIDIYEIMIDDDHF